MRLPTSDRTTLAIVLAVALAIRLALLATNSGLTMDSPLYVRMGEAFAHGERGASPAHHGYPLLVAAASRALPGREWPGRMVSLVASLALVALVYAIARSNFPRLWVAGAAALAVALHPVLAVYGGAIMTEASFLALAFTGLLWLERGSHMAGGAWLGAAWWIRPEAAVIAPLAALLARGGVRAKALVLAGALLAALPYAVLLRVETGRWTLSPKTALVRAPFGDRREAEWRLEDSSAIADTVGLRERLARSGGAIARAYPSQLLAHSRRLLEAWPLPLLALSLLGLARREGWRPHLAPLACTFVYPLLAAPADVRFAQLAVPSLALAAAGGAHRLAERAAAWRVLVSAGALAGLVWCWLGPAGERVRRFDDGPMTSMREAGAWIAAHAAAGDVVLDRKAYVPFFAGLAHAQLPDEPLDRLLEYARASGARWLVVEEYVTATIRPQLAPLLDPATLAGERRVRLAHVVRPAPGEGVAVFEVVR